LKHLITFQTKLEFDIEIDLVPDIWSMSVMMMFKLYCLHYNSYWPNRLLENHDLPNSTSLNLIFPPQSRFRHFCVLKAIRDCYPHEQVLWNYGSAEAALPILFA
jgi:hypothetical protein